MTQPRLSVVDFRHLWNNAKLKFVPRAAASFFKSLSTTNESGTSWYGRPDPEDRINRKPKDRIFDRRTLFDAFLMHCKRCKMDWIKKPFFYCTTLNRKTIFDQICTSLLSLLTFTLPLPSGSRYFTHFYIYDYGKLSAAQLNNRKTPRFT